MRSGRRRRLVLALCAAAVTIGAFLVVLAVTRGVGGVVRLFTTPWLEAESGARYTPTGAAKRFIEKMDERRDSEPAE